MTGSTLRRRIGALESTAGGPKRPPRIVVIWPGDELSDDGDDEGDTVYLHVVYDDPPEARDGKDADDTN